MAPDAQVWIRLSPLLVCAALAICGCAPAAPETRDVTPQPRSYLYASAGALVASRDTRSSGCSAKCPSIIRPSVGLPVSAQAGSCAATRVWPTPLAADPRTPQPALEWALLTPGAREGNELLAIADDGTVVQLQLCNMAVSDCRRDCYEADVEANLAPLSDADSLCIVYSRGQGSDRIGTVWKLWVDRYECRDSGRVAPP